MSTDSPNPRLSRVLDRFTVAAAYPVMREELLRYFQARGSSPEASEDLLHALFERLLRITVDDRVIQLELSFGVYVRRAAHNAWVDDVQLRTRQRRMFAAVDLSTRVDEGDREVLTAVARESASPEFILLNKDVQRRFAEAAQKLRASELQAVVSVSRHRSLASAARALALPESTLRSRYTRAVRHLRRQLTVGRTPPGRWRKARRRPDGPPQHRR